MHMSEPKCFFWRTVHIRRLSMFRQKKRIKGTEHLKQGSQVVTKQVKVSFLQTLILAMIGTACSFAGLLHEQEWIPASCLVGICVAVIACTLDVLAARYAINQRHLEDEKGAIKGDLSGRDQFVRSMAILQVVSQIIYIGAIFCTPVEPKDNAIIQAVSQVFYLGAIFGMPVEVSDDEAEETITKDLEEQTKRQDEVHPG
jgi:hypothetical protein